MAVQFSVAIIAGVVIECCMEGVELQQPVPMLCITAISAVLLIAIFMGFKFYGVSRSYVRTKPWMSIFWTVFLALGVIIPLAFIEELIPAELRTDNNGEMLTQMLRIDKGLSVFQPGYIVVCMLVPLMEEMVFRGAILNALTEWFSKKGNGNTWLAIVISALFFAAIHMNPAQMPHAFLMGLLLGWLYINTRSIVLCFIVHWINNSMAFVLINAFPMIPADSDLQAYIGGDGMAMVKAIGFSLMMALPAIYQLNRIFTSKR